MTGPDEGGLAGRGHLRAAQADREQAITVLKAAYAQGRLTKDELEARAGQAFASRTYAELAALTADIPAPAPVTASAGSPGRTLARATKRAGFCLLAAVALMEAAFLTGNFLLIVVATFAGLGAAGFLGYGIIDAWQEWRNREQLTSGPGPGPGLGGPGSAGGPPVRGPVPPGSRGDLNRAEARSIRVRAGRARMPQTRVGRPPMTRAQRGPTTWPTQPTMGPPIGVEPSQASAHSAITRPRISGRAAS